jgi:putative spermidine/putrescine transport system permease protein
MSNTVISRRRGGRLFVPGMAWLCYLFLLVPGLVVIVISFSASQEIAFPPKAFSLHLYAAFFTDRAWWGALVESVIIASCTTVLSVCLTIPAAYALARRTFPGSTVLHGVFVSPMLVPVIVLGLGLYLQFAAIHLLDKPITLILAHTMLVVPFVMLSASSALKHIDASLETAAAVMGAPRSTIFFWVVLPQLKHAILTGAMFAFLLSLDEVVIAYFLSGPNTTTLPVKMYSALRWEVSPVLSAVSTLLTVFALVVALGIAALQKQEQKA